MVKKTIKLIFLSLLLSSVINIQPSQASDLFKSESHEDKKLAQFNDHFHDLNNSRVDSHNHVLEFENPVRENEALGTKTLFNVSELFEYFDVYEVDYIAESKRLKNLARDGNYRKPSKKEMQQFHNLVMDLLNQDFDSAQSKSSQLGYEIVIYVDQKTNKHSLVLREALLIDKQLRGWGTYWFNLSKEVKSAIIEIPHPIHDIDTPQFSTDIYLKSNSAGMLMAGAHRRKADASHNSKMIFNVVHKAWIEKFSDLVFWQIHGFSMKNHNHFPSDTDVVIANGKKSTNTYMEETKRQLRRAGHQGYDITDGEVFNALGAKTNIQVRDFHQRGQNFVHIELERHIRKDSLYAGRVANAIASAITNTVR